MSFTRTVAATLGGIECDFHKKTYTDLRPDYQYTRRGEPPHDKWSSVNEAIAAQGFLDRIEAEKAKQEEPSKGLYYKDRHAHCIYDEHGFAVARLSPPDGPPFPNAEANAALFVNAEKTARERDVVLAVLSRYGRYITWLRGDGYRHPEPIDSIRDDVVAVLAEIGGAE